MARANVIKHPASHVMSRPPSQARWPIMKKHAQENKAALKISFHASLHLMVVTRSTLSPSLSLYALGAPSITQADEAACLCRSAVDALLFLTTFNTTVEATGPSVSEPRCPKSPHLHPLPVPTLASLNKFSMRGCNHHHQHYFTLLVRT